MGGSWGITSASRQRNHGMCLNRRVLPKILSERSNADLRPLIVCTISSIKSRQISLRHVCNETKWDKTRTRNLGTLGFKLVPLVPAISRDAMDDDAERGGR